MHQSVGSCSNDEGDGNKNIRKGIGLIRKTTNLHMQCRLT